MFALTYRSFESQHDDSHLVALSNILKWANLVKKPTCTLCKHDRRINPSADSEYVYCIDYFITLKWMMHVLYEICTHSCCYIIRTEIKRVFFFKFTQIIWSFEFTTYNSSYLVAVDLCVWHSSKTMVATCNKLLCIHYNFRTTCLRNHVVECLLTDMDVAGSILGPSQTLRSFTSHLRQFVLFSLRLYQFSSFLVEMKTQRNHRPAR